MLARGLTQLNLGRGQLWRALRWVPAGAWMGGIFYISHQPAPPNPVASSISPLLAHIGIYAILTVLLYVAITPVSRRTPRWVPVSISFGLAVLCGAGDEVHQAFVPGRVASEIDVLADAVGAGIAALALLILAGRPFGGRETFQHERQSPKR